MRIRLCGGVDLKVPRVTRYATPEAIVLACARFEGKAYDHFERDALAAAVRGDRQWGFADCSPKAPRIHFWADPTSPLHELIEFFAHEVAHLVSDGGRLVHAVRRTLPAEEARAQTFAAVAGLALELAQRYHVGP